MSLFRYLGGRGGHGNPSGGGGGVVDTLLQTWVNGMFNGAPCKIYSSTTGFLAPSTDLLLVNAVLASPAIGSIVTVTDILLTAVNLAPVIAESLTDKFKYLVIGSNAYFASIGLSGDTFNPDIIVNRTDWYEDDTVDINALHVMALENVLTQYIGAVSTASPETGGEYTTVFQSADVSGADVHRIGISLSVTAVGSGSPSLTPATVVTDRNGTSAVITNTAGDAGVDEHTHATDGTLTADGPTVTPITSNRDLTLTILTSGDSHLGADPTASIPISVPAGDALFVIFFSITHGGVTLGDNSGVPLGSPPFSFVEDAYAGGNLSVYRSGTNGVLASQFDGTVLIHTGGFNVPYVVFKASPNLACTHIRPIAANTATMTDSTGGLVQATVAYNQAFTNTHNLAFAAFSTNGPFAGSARSGWTEMIDLITGFCQFGIELQYKQNGGDTVAQENYNSAPFRLWGAALEYEATA